MQLKEFIRFLNRLEDNYIFYKLSKVRKESVMVEVAAVGQRWRLNLWRMAQLRLKSLLLMGIFMMGKRLISCLQILLIK